MARLSEARTRMPGVDEALSATGALNELRAQDNRPAHQLSARLTEHALDMLGDQTSRTLDDFTRAFEQFERTSPGQNFIEHYARERAFIPGGSNSGPPPEPGALTPELQQLLNLATEVMERDYELPFGNQSTLSDAGREWFAEAVRAALDGDPSLLRTGGDPGAIAALRLQRTQTARNENENPSFDTRAAQQHLRQAEQAALRHQSEQDTSRPAPATTGAGTTEVRTNCTETELKRLIDPYIHRGTQMAASGRTPDVLRSQQYVFTNMLNILEDARRRCGGFTQEIAYAREQLEDTWRQMQALGVR